MGLIQLELKNLEKAKILFEECIHLNPTFNLSYVGLGNVYYELGDYQLAENYHLKAYNMEKKDLQVVISYANTLMSEEVINLIKLKFLNYFRNMKTLFRFTLKL